MNSEPYSKLSVLVVDDNEVNALILSKMLNMFRVYTDQTFSGINALKLYRQIRYDIIFVDHIMPEMNGEQVTLTVRRLEKEPHKTRIFILTASLNDDVLRRYKKAGADGVFEKPLKLAQLINIFKKWFPKVDFEQPKDRLNPNHLDVNDIYKLRVILKVVNEIDFDQGMKYAFGNPDHFVNILKASIKEIQYDISVINYHHELGDIIRIRNGIHNIKSVLSNIGAIELLEEIKQWETILAKKRPKVSIEKLNSLIYHLEEFLEKLKTALMKYEVMKPLVDDEDREVHPMTKDEYEQCVLNTIYYIKSYEYDSIIHEIEKLIHTKDIELKNEFQKALEEIKEFNYEKALIRIIRVTEKD